MKIFAVIGTVCAACFLASCLFGLLAITPPSFVSGNVVYSAQQPPCNITTTTLTSTTGGLTYTGISISSCPLIIVYNHQFADIAIVLILFALACFIATILFFLDSCIVVNSSEHSEDD